MSEPNGQQLPPGWVATSLRDVLLDTETTDPSRQGKGEFSYIDIEAIDNKRQLIAQPKRLANSAAPSRARNKLAAGDVLFCLVRPYLKNIAVVTIEFDDAVASTAFFVSRSPAGVVSRFVFNLLRRDSFIHAIPTYGSSPPAARDIEFLNQPILLPPSAEQERISDALDELLSDLDAGVAALERVQAKLKHYRAAVLKAAVEGTLVPTAKPYPIRRIGDAIESLGQGWSPKCESQPAADSETWAVIKTTAIQPLRYLEEHNKTLPAALKARPRLELIEGDLLITRAGPRTRVGIACLVKRTRPRLMLCDKAYRLRCNKDTLSPAFLEVVLNAPHIVTALDKLKTGINDSGLNLTQDRFADLLVPFPPPAEQEAIVEAVEDQLSVIEHLEADLEAKLKSAQALRQSILRHAFTGQLVPQDPKDEPAAELLKRIAAQREELARQALAAKKTKPKAPPKRAARQTGKRHSHD